MTRRDENEPRSVTAVGSGDVTRGVWYSAESSKLGRYDQGIKRHALKRPATWKADKTLLTAFISAHYPDARELRYKGGVLRFRWNGDEGSGEAYESGTTPGKATWPSEIA